VVIVEEKLLQKIIELSKELEAKEMKIECLEKELESLRPKQSGTQMVLEKRRKMKTVRNLF
jgi:predicted RNase H-like nuclease (RuvC/YqgF family)